MIKSLSGAQCLHPAGRVQVLPEADRLVALEGPDMDERNVQMFAGPLGDPPVAADDDDGCARVQALVRLGRELAPPLLLAEVEDVPPHLLQPAVEPAVRQALGLVPLD